MRECGEAFQISRERVRQLANAALDRLRAEARHSVAAMATERVEHGVESFER